MTRYPSFVSVSHSGKYTRLKSCFNKNNDDIGSYGSGKEEYLLAYQFLKGLNEFGTRARHPAASTRGRHRIGLYVRVDRPRLYHGLRGFGVYQFCPQRNLRSRCLCRGGDSPNVGKRRTLGYAQPGFCPAACDRHRHGRQRSCGDGVGARGLSSTAKESETRGADFRYWCFVFLAGRSPSFRKSLAQYFLPHLSHTGHSR